MLRQTTRIEQWMLIAAGIALVYPKALFDAIGIALMTIVVVLQVMRGKALARKR